MASNRFIGGGWPGTCARAISARVTGKVGAFGCKPISVPGNQMGQRTNAAFQHRIKGALFGLCE